MTGRPGDRTMEIEWRKYCVVPRAHPLHPCVFACFHRSGSKGTFRLPGATLYGGTFARSYSVSIFLRQGMPRFLIDFLNIG